MRRVADAQESGPGPSRESVDYDRQEADVPPIVQFSYSIAQEGFQICNLFAERRQPSLPDFVGLPFWDHEGALPIALTD